jgi:RNA polymerase sigma factor (TIGR02999 family)
VTDLLLACRNGDAAALEKLTPLVYDELHRLASHYLRGERAGHTLQPTALVGEAYLRLVDDAARLDWKGRAHFVAIAACHMRRILVDHARKRSARKRAAGARPVTFDETLFAEERAPDLVALDDALQALLAFDERKARIIELKYFGGLTHEEIAEALGVHANTIAKEVRVAEAWLEAELARADEP